MKWTQQSTRLAIANYKNITHAEIAAIIGKSPKTVAEFLRKRGHRKCPNYTETERYILDNFPAAQCLQFIPSKSLNALKIKQCRLKNSTRASASMQ